MRSRTKSQTIYISGPITNKLNHPIQFEKAESWLTKEGHRVLNPLDIEHPGSKCTTKQETWDYYMKEAIGMLVHADCVYMLEGWERSKGARLELHLATELNIPVHFAHEDHKYV